MLYKNSKILLSRRSKSDPVTGAMDGLPPAFRKWSIIAFALESTAVILTFLFMVFFLGWKINATMINILLIVMVISAFFLLMTGNTTAEK
jgi:hypothetical protein